MNSIKVIPKTVDLPSIVVMDDLVPSLLTGEFYFITLTNYSKFMGLSDARWLIDNYSFPMNDANMLSFLQGHNPELFKQISYYNDTHTEGGS